MKKCYLAILLLIFLFPLLGNAMTKEEMTQINYTKVLEIEKPEGFTSVQGMIVTDKYFVVAVINDNPTDNVTLLIYNKEDYTLADIEKNGTMTFSFGHANDFAYDATKNEIYIINNTKIHVVDSNTFQHKNDLEIKDGSYVGIAKDKNTNEFIFRNHEKAFIYNNDLVQQSSFSIPTNLTRQAISFYNNKLYYSCFENGEVSKDQIKYDGVLEKGANAIYVYSKTGELEQVFYIPAGIGEIEAMEFDENGLPYLLFNTGAKTGAIYTPTYSSKENQITVKTDEEEKESKATLLDGNGQIETVSIKDGKYEFSPILYKEPGVYKYTIKKENNLLRNNEDTINVEVVVTYDAKINELTSKANYEKEGFITKTEPEKNEEKKVFCEEIDNVFYDKDGNVTTEENFMTSCGTVRNPQTGSSISYLVWIIGLIGIIGFVIYKKRKFFRI